MRRCPVLPLGVPLAGALCGLLSPSVASAQEPGLLPRTATVAPDDPLSLAAEQMLEIAPVRGGAVGQRPYSVRELVRLARAVRADAAVRLDRGTARASDARAVALADAILAGTGDAPEDGTPARRAFLVRPLQALVLSSAASGASPRRVPSNGLGGIDAASLPALDGRFGRPAVQGVATSVEPVSMVGVGGWLALVAQPRASWIVARRDAPHVAAAGGRVIVEPQRLYARAVAANVALQAGIDERSWGQASVAPGSPGGVLISANPRPLRAVSVGADTAFALPWVLRRLGRWRAELLVADLGADQVYPHTKLATYTVTLMPTPNVELGAGILDQFGGRGAPPLSFGQRVADLFPFLGWLKKGADRQASNKIGDLEARVRVPAFRGATLYWEMSPDDFDARRLKSVLWEDSGHLFGLTLPRLRDDGTLAFDAAFQHTSVRLYEHGQFTSGVTYRGQIIGSPLGPNAYAASAGLSWRPAATRTLRAAVTAEHRDPSPYVAGTVGNAPNGALTFTKAAQGVIEGRVRAEVAGETGALGRGRRYTARAGLERVTNENFVVTGARLRPFAELGLRTTF